MKKNSLKKIKISQEQQVQDQIEDNQDFLSSEDQQNQRENQNINISVQQQSLFQENQDQSFFQIGGSIRFQDSIEQNQTQSMTEQQQIKQQQQQQNIPNPNISQFFQTNQNIQQIQSILQENNSIYTLQGNLGENQQQQQQQQQQQIEQNQNIQQQAQQQQSEQNKQYKNQDTIPRIIKGNSGSNKSTNTNGSSNYLQGSSIDNQLPLKSTRMVQNKTNQCGQDYTMVGGKVEGKGVLLGQGGFGQVFLVQNKINKQQRAMKVINKNHFKQNKTHQLLQEIEILKQLVHPNILKIYEYYEDSEYLYIITELCEEGNLFERIVKEGKQLKELEVCQIMEQVIGAIQYAHEKQIMHRDIKLDNILIDFIEGRKFRIKLIDWGLSVGYSQGTKIKQLCGTINYMAPEIFQGDYDYKADIWSCGIVLYVLLSGTPPFEGTADEIINNIKNPKYKLKFQGGLWKNISDQAKDLIQKMLRRDPIKRFSAQQALEHVWFEQMQTDSQNISTQVLQENYQRLKQYSNTSPIQKYVLQFIASHCTPKRERQRLEILFSKLDTNNSGTLTKDEVINGYKKIFANQEECENEFNQIIEKLDADNDNEIDIEEFITHSMDIKHVLDEKNLKQAFDLFDENGDGQITNIEVKNVIGVDSDIDDEIWQQIISEVDQDNDGLISFQEFKNLMIKFVEQNQEK